MRVCIGGCFCPYLKRNEGRRRDSSCDYGQDHSHRMTVTDVHQFRLSAEFTATAAQPSHRPRYASPPHDIHLRLPQQVHNSFFLKRMFRALPVARQASSKTSRGVVRISHRVRSFPLSFLPIRFAHLTSDLSRKQRMQLQPPPLLKHQ
jgi:hypothetical protein